MMTIEKNQMAESTKPPGAAQIMARRSREGGTGSGAVFLTVAGLVTAFGTASCCGLPLILAGFGLGSAWLIGPALLAAPYLRALLIVSPFLLIGGAVLLWRQGRVACAPNALCAHPAMRAATLVCLLLGAALLYLGFAYRDG